MSAIVRKCTVDEIEAASAFESLLASYAAESAIEGLPPPKAKMELYRRLESAGSIQSFGAFLEDDLIGLLLVLTTILPHYSDFVSVIESFFVSPLQRKTGAGLKLLREAELFAKGIGSKGLLISAPSGGSLADVLEKMDGYRETNRVFFRSFLI